MPPEQVIDTVDLYFVKARQRRLSLRFLSWFVLHQHIQTDNHDSIEDARSALNLYYAYQDLESEGLFDQKLDEIYKEGRQYVSFRHILFYVLTNLHTSLELQTSTLTRPIPSRCPSAIASAQAYGRLQPTDVIYIRQQTEHTECPCGFQPECEHLRFTWVEYWGELEAMILERMEI